MSEEKENKMKDEKDQKKVIEKNKAADKKAVSKDKPKSGNKTLYVALFVLVIFFSIALVFINNRLNKIESDFEQSNVNNNSVDQEIGDQLKGVLSRFTAIQIKLEELESKQDVLSHSLSQPEQQQIHINEDYALTEIEHLLTIANYNLQIDQNVTTALSAMEAAETRLKGLTEPAAFSAREQLISDMNDLRSINQADLSGAAFSLSDFINRVDKLVIKQNVVMESQEQVQEKNEEPVEGIKHFFALVFKELKSLVVITRDKDIGKARLLPDEVYFLRANLKLELANARFAVFNRDTENFHVSIELIQHWLDNYFDLSDADARNIYDSLSNMKKMKLELPELDISSSLESVRALSHIQDSRYQDETDNESSEEIIPQQ